MSKITVVCLLLLFCSIGVSAQHKVFFETRLSKTKVKNSLYNSIKLLDSRADTSLGFVQTGVLNRKAKVVTKQSLAKEVSNIFSSLIDTNAANGEMLLHLRQFSFAELTAGMSESGYCAFQADLYTQKQDQYQLIGSIDTLFHLRSSIDVTNALLRTGSDTLTGFIQDHLLKQPTGKIALSYSDLLHIDSIEKLSIKVYNTTTYVDGLYLSYNSFKNQTPDQEIIVTNPYLYPGNVKALNEKGKLKDVKLNKTYAVVYKGSPYIVTQYGFYPLKKENNEFLFTGQAKVSANTGTVIAASAMFGILGALITNGGDDATFEMKIDHRNGTLIKLKEIIEVKKASTYNPDSW
ncbi:hypothetical protein [Mucilaginibacter sp.]|jgi:hypothetical protein|uniref:hypothetical protein n=1 Tax=Mucilaginibacter sp. TaxID=1882438 RepID=UPI0035659EE9